MSQLAAADRVRRFNRFYTRRMGLLNPGLLQSPFSLAEVRVLYEIAHQERPTAKSIASILQLDRGYLSRLLRGLRQRGLLTARAEEHDRRERRLSLTARGRKAFGTLNARATDEIAAMLHGLSRSEQHDLLRSIGTIEGLLNEEHAAARPVVALRNPEPGDLGWVVQRHGELYAQEYGWNADFERLVAGIVGEFASAPSDSGNRCWIATVDGERAGCIFLVPSAPDVARLRLLLVEPWARGLASAPVWSTSASPQPERAATARSRSGPTTCSPPRGGSTSAPDSVWSRASGIPASGSRSWGRTGSFHSIIQKQSGKPVNVPACQSREQLT